MSILRGKFQDIMPVPALAQTSYEVNVEGEVRCVGALCTCVVSLGDDIPRSAFFRLPVCQHYRLQDIPDPLPPKASAVKEPRHWAFCFALKVFDYLRPEA